MAERIAAAGARLVPEDEGRLAGYAHG
ncbi:MAG: hypothetical protein JWO90_2799, partial [Solirubrobacterales bacterium]|nr:hypothetical protein [Solirubrobacterales bacterium]